MYRSTIVALR